MFPVKVLNKPSVLFFVSLLCFFLSLFFLIKFLDSLAHKVLDCFFQLKVICAIYHGLAFTCPESALETPKQCVKSVPN